MAPQRRGRKPTERYWVEWIRSKVVNNPRMTLAEVVRAMEQAAIESGRADYPAPRTVQRIRAEIRKAEPHDRKAYEYVNWPDTFERGDLPWEAARCVLEYMAAPPRPKLFGWHTPMSLHQARWLWWMTQSAPSLDLHIRSGLALTLADLQSRRGDQRRREAEAEIIAQVAAEDSDAFARRLLDWAIEDEGDQVASLEAAGKPAPRDYLEQLMAQRKEVEPSG